MTVAGQQVVSDRRAFVTQIFANAAVPDLSVVTSVYLYVLRGNGSETRWDCTIASQTATVIFAAYTPVPGDNDTAGETVHVRPYLVVPALPDTPCVGYEIQVLKK